MFDDQSYTAWSVSRVKFLIDNLGGPAWFDGKKVLDVGCGHGYNGKKLITLGAQLSFADGRESHVDHLLEEGLTAHVMDQDQEWTIDETFDLIIHWGVLYHLNNWRRNLRQTLEHAPLVSLETTIQPTRWIEERKRGTVRDQVNSYVDGDDVKRPEPEHYDQAVGHVGSLCSSGEIESCLSSLGATYVRYDDGCLNASNHKYNWKDDSNVYVEGYRRLWMVRRT